MTARLRYAYVACLLLALPAAAGAQRPAAIVRQEREQAAREVPKLAEVLALKPGMIVADVGAGGGAMSVVMAKWLGPEGHDRHGNAMTATIARHTSVTEVTAAGFRHLTTMTQWPPEETRGRLFLVLFEKSR